ncbi:MAG: hypothetical protein ABW212_11990 [Pseudonocardia sediminis]
MSQGDKSAANPTETTESSETGAADPESGRVPTAQSNTAVDVSPDTDGVHMSEEVVDTEHDDDRSEG